MKQKTIAAKTALALAAILWAFIFSGCLYDIVDLPDPRLLVEPYITTQPLSQSFDANTSPSVQLLVDIDQWTEQDGTLSYQWYRFDSIVQYLQNGGKGTPIPNAVTETYTPVTLAKNAGDKNYFYVEVTNFDPSATNKQTATTRSEVAVISFNAPGDPAIPLITRQPADTQARFGRPVSPLSVRATVNALPANTGVLDYQWFHVTVDADGAITDSDNDGIPDAEEVAGADASDYTPVAEALGNVFYFVRVAHTIGRVDETPGPDEDNDGEPDYIIPADPGVSSFEYSVPATVFIDRGLRAGTPVINAQPKPSLYIASEPIVPLTVEAESPDFGALTFHWYSNTRAASSGGTLVETQLDSEAEDLPSGGKKSSFTPPDGSAFYYVVVTNTNTNVVGAQTATAATRAVSVRRQLDPAPASGNAIVTIQNPLDPNQQFNYVRGYGGMEVAWANFPETFPEETELQYDPDRLGFNILRIMLPVSNTNIDVAMEDLVVTTNRRPHYYENVKIENKYGGYVAASPWSAPREWKSNNSINGGGYLRHEYYKQYAAYLRSFAQHMNNRGAPIYCISIQNEPNYAAGYDGCEWTPEEMRDFYAEHGRYTEGVRGWGGGKQIPRVLTMNGESANNPNINSAAIQNSAAYANIDLFGRHVYGERRINLWALHNFVQARDGKEVWMTEHNINSANAAGYYNDSKWDYMWKYLNDVDLVMRLNNENAFVWWASKRFYSMVGDGQYGTPVGQALPRGWGLSHYAKYTIDTTCIETAITGTTANGTAVAAAVNTDVGDMDNISARITAYISQDGNEISLILWTPTLTSGADGYDMGNIEIVMPFGFKIDSATGIESYKVSDTENRFQEAYAPLVNAARDRAYVTLPRSRLISVKFTKLIEE